MSNSIPPPYNISQLKINPATEDMQVFYDKYNRAAGDIIADGDSDSDSIQVTTYDNRTIRIPVARASDKVIFGLEVEITNGIGYEANVNPGIFQIGNIKYENLGGAVFPIPAAPDANNERVDLISIDATNNFTYTLGLAGSPELPPDLPPDSLFIAYIFVNFGTAPVVIDTILPYGTIDGQSIIWDKVNGKWQLVPNPALPLGVVNDMLRHDGISFVPQQILDLGVANNDMLVWDSVANKFIAKQVIDEGVAANDIAAWDDILQKYAGKTITELLNQLGINGDTLIRNSIGWIAAKPPYQILPLIDISNSGTGNTSWIANVFPNSATVPLGFGFTKAQLYGRFYLGNPSGQYAIGCNRVLTGTTTEHIPNSTSGTGGGGYWTGAGITGSTRLAYFHTRQFPVTEGDSYVLSIFRNAGIGNITIVNAFIILYNDDYDYFQPVIEP